MKIGRGDEGGWVVGGKLGFISELEKIGRGMKGAG